MLPCHYTGHKENSAHHHSTDIRSSVLASKVIIMQLMSIVKALSVAVYNFKCCLNLFAKLAEFEQHRYIFTVHNFCINDSVRLTGQVSRNKHPSLHLKISAFKYIMILINKFVKSTKLTISVIPFDSPESTKFNW